MPLQPQTIPAIITTTINLLLAHLLNHHFTLMIHNYTLKTHNDLLLQHNLDRLTISVLYTTNAARTMELPFRGLSITSPLFIQNEKKVELRCSAL
jgi:hypothetical protein